MEPTELTVNELHSAFWVSEELKDQAEPFMVAKHRASMEAQGYRIVGEPIIRWERPDPLSSEYRHGVWIGNVNSYAVEA